MDGQQRKTMFIDEKQAHLVPEWREEVHAELLQEPAVESDECGKLVVWLCGCRRAGALLRSMRVVRSCKESYLEELCKVALTCRFSLDVQHFLNALPSGMGCNSTERVAMGCSRGIAMIQAGNFQFVDVFLVE